MIARRALGRRRGGTVRTAARLAAATRRAQREAAPHPPAPSSPSRYRTRRRGYDLADAAPIARSADVTLPAVSSSIEAQRLVEGPATASSTLPPDVLVELRRLGAGRCRSPGRRSRRPRSAAATKTSATHLPAPPDLSRCGARPAARRRGGGAPAAGPRRPAAAARPRRGGPSCSWAASMRVASSSGSAARRVRGRSVWPDAREAVAQRVLHLGGVLVAVAPGRARARGRRRRRACGGTSRTSSRAARGGGPRLLQAREVGQRAGLVGQARRPAAG